MDKHLLDILVDPVTKGPLIYDKKRQELISRGSRRLIQFGTVFRSCCRKKHANSAVMN